VTHASCPPRALDTIKAKLDFLEEIGLQRKCAARGARWSPRALQRQPRAAHRARCRGRGAGRAGWLLLTVLTLVLPTMTVSSADAASVAVGDGECHGPTRHVHGAGGAPRPRQAQVYGV